MKHEMDTLSYARSANPRGKPCDRTGFPLDIRSLLGGVNFPPTIVTLTPAIPCQPLSHCATRGYRNRISQTPFTWTSVNNESQSLIRSRVVIEEDRLVVQYRDQELPVIPRVLSVHGGKPTIQTIASKEVTTLERIAKLIAKPVVKIRRTRQEGLSCFRILPSFDEIIGLTSRATTVQTGSAVICNLYRISPCCSTT